MVPRSEFASGDTKRCMGDVRVEDKTLSASGYGLVESQEYDLLSAKRVDLRLFQSRLPSSPAKSLQLLG
jgi:hypothetical protein